MEHPSYRSFLIHHGRKGQRWGVQNGPPYPLGMSNKKYKRLNTVGLSPHDKEITEQSRSDAKKAKSVEERIRENEEASRKAAKDVKPERVFRKLEVVMNAATLHPISAAHAAKDVYDEIRTRNDDRKVENRILENKNIDPDTGLRLKQGEWSVEKDLKEINPGFRTFDYSYKANCMFCTTAFDLRRRGYDVMAAKTPNPQDTWKLSAFYPKAELHIIDPAISKGDLTSLTQKELVSQGNGARGNLMMAWNYASGGGHSVAYEIQNNRLVSYDAQSGKVIKKPEDLLKRGRYVQYARLDNIDFDKKQIREAVRP